MGELGSNGIITHIYLNHSHQYKIIDFMKEINIGNVHMKRVFDFV